MSATAKDGASTIDDARHSASDLRQLQSLPLDAKVRLSIQRIRQWYDLHDGLVYVAFSGGLDSTVVRHLVLGQFEDVPLVFHNSEVEFPENRAFAKANGAIVTRARKTFQEIVEQYGWPVISKRVAHYVDQVRTSHGETLTKQKRLTGIGRDGTFSYNARIPAKWQYLLDAPFKISARCCHWLRKLPGQAYTNETGRVPYLGIRADEGDGREHAWRLHGCNLKNTAHPRSWPIAFWTHTDVTDYIDAEHLTYSPLYDMGYRRTGCMYCCFGVQAEGMPNRFDLLKQTHPKLYQYVMDRLGLSKVLPWLCGSKPCRLYDVSYR